MLQIRRVGVTLIAATLLVLLAQALWLTVYRFARERLPDDGVPLLRRQAAIVPPDSDSTIRIVDAERDMVERAVIRTAFDLIPAHFFPGVADSARWEFDWWPRLSSGPSRRPRPQMIAHTPNTGCKSTPCGGTQSILARLYVLNLGPASATLTLDWLASGDTIKRGLATLTLRRAPDAWRLASLRTRRPPAAPKDAAEFLHEFYNAPLPVF